MRKLSALLLISVFVLSLAACKKNNTSSDASSTSLASLQSEQSESASSKQAGEDITVISEESKPESVSSTVSPDKNGNTSKTSPKQNVSSQPKQSTPSQNPDSGTQPTQPSQPTQPTKLNPKTDFKIGRYRAISLDNNNNQICYSIDLEFQKGEQYNGYLTYYAQQFYTKELFQQITKERFEQNGFTPEYTSIILNGVTYYGFNGDFNFLNGVFEITDTLVKVDNQEGKLDNLSLNADGNLVLETNGGVIDAKIGTIFTFVQ